MPTPQLPDRPLAQADRQPRKQQRYTGWWEAPTGWAPPPVPSVVTDAAPATLTLGPYRGQRDRSGSAGSTELLFLIFEDGGWGRRSVMIGENRPDELLPCLLGPCRRSAEPVFVSGLSVGGDVQEFTSFECVPHTNAGADVIIRWLHADEPVGRTPMPIAVPTFSEFALFGCQRCVDHPSARTVGGIARSRGKVRPRYRAASDWYDLLGAHR